MVRLMLPNMQGAAASSSSVEDTLRQELNSQREVSARLRQDLAAARQQLHDVSAQWDEQQSSLQEQLQQQESELQRLQLELQQRPTAARVAELQQQIRVLQAVGYGSLPEEDLGGPAGSSGEALSGLEGSASLGVEAGGRTSDSLGPGGSQGGAGGINLEGLLLAKNRKLEHEVTVARLALAEANQQLEACREQVRLAVAAAAAGGRSPGKRNRPTVACWCLWWKCVQPWLQHTIRPPVRLTAACLHPAGHGAAGPVAAEDRPCLAAGGGPVQRQADSRQQRRSSTQQGQPGCPLAQALNCSGWQQRPGACGVHRRCCSCCSRWRRG